MFLLHPRPETQSMMIRSILIYNFHSERKAAYLRQAIHYLSIPKKSNKNNKAITYQNYTQSVSLAIQFCLVFATRISELDNGETGLLGVIKTY